MSHPQPIVFRIFVFVAAAVVFIGCGTTKPAGEKAKPAKAAEEKPISKPAVPAGKIAMVNEKARFTVISFSIGNVPPVDQRLNVYRDNLKVGELKVTGPGNDINTVADVTVGEVHVGDEVRVD